MDVLNADGRFSLIQEYAANGEAACLAQTETLLTDRPDVEVILTQIDHLHALSLTRHNKKPPYEE